MVIGEDDRVIEIRERFKGIDEGLWKGLVADGIDAFPKQLHPFRAAELGIFRSLGWCRHDVGSFTAFLKDFAYIIWYMPFMVYALYHHSDTNIG